MKDITLKEAQDLVTRGKAKWHEADWKVRELFARYNGLVGAKFGVLYDRDYNPATGKDDGDFHKLALPGRNARIEYYVTWNYSMVYKLDARTGKFRESKTAYKALEACERAIEKAIDRREEIAKAVDNCEAILPKLEARERMWRELESRAEQVMQNRRRA